MRRRLDEPSQAGGTLARRSNAAAGCNSADERGHRRARAPDGLAGPSWLLSEESADGWPAGSSNGSGTGVPSGSSTSRAPGRGARQRSQRRREGGTGRGRAQGETRTGRVVSGLAGCVGALAGRNGGGGCGRHEGRGGVAKGAWRRSSAAATGSGTRGRRKPGRRAREGSEWVSGSRCAASEAASRQTPAGGAASLSSARERQEPPCQPVAVPGARCSCPCQTCTPAGYRSIARSDALHWPPATAHRPRHTAAASAARTHRPAPAFRRGACVCSGDRHGPPSRRLNSERPRNPRLRAAVGRFARPAASLANCRRAHAMLSPLRAVAIGHAPAHQPIGVRFSTRCT